MSPTIVTVVPSRSLPRAPPPCRRRRIVNASSSAWVGCSWVPSPALTIAASIQPEFASTSGAPDELCRMTTASAPIAASVCAVSLRLSPFETLDPLALKLMTSALRRFAAASNEMRVRVESSKKRLTTVLPRRVGSFFTSRLATSAMSSATSRIAIASSRPRSRVLSRCLMPSPPLRRHRPGRYRPGSFRPGSRLLRSSRTRRRHSR